MANFPPGSILLPIALLDINPFPLTLNIYHGRFPPPYSLLLNLNECNLRAAEHFTAIR